MAPERFREIEELYHGALARPSAERAAFLAQAHPEVRREVESLLAQPSGLASLDVSRLGSITGTARKLALGEQLGPYKIEALLGAGGMGEVFRAHDSRLRRDVAIKTSSQRFNERFEREARAIAALNHPNICQIYDIGADYIVMELVEGSSPKGPLPADEVLRMAGQIAAALEAAHEKGIVHRDLKPLNLKITSSGLVKVLDFGLAKNVSNPTSEDSTITNLTELGTAIGTPAYMAPEQAEGKPVDKRADVWAFGVVLYELLTGQRPFRGDSVQGTLAAVMTKEPDLSVVPASVRRLLRACLKKDPKERLSNIGDWRLLLDEEAVGTTPPVRSASKLPWIVSAIAALVAAGALGMSWNKQTDTRVGAPLVRIDADLGTGVSLFSSNGPAFAISPDGTRIAFSSRDADGAIRLFWRRLDQSTATPIAGTESAFTPFFSPDGKQVGFYADGSLKKVDLDSGAVTVLANAVNPIGGTWAEDGTILFHRAPSLDLWTIPSNGGDARSIPRSPANIGRWWPQFLPGGKTILFTAVPGLGGDVEKMNIEYQKLADGERKLLVAGASYAKYLASGHLAYLRRGTLFVRQFDVNHMALSGPETPLLQGIEYSTQSGAAQLDVARDGSLVYRAVRPGSDLSTVQWLDGSGRLEPLIAAPGDYRSLKLSPDGKHLAIAIAEGSSSSDIYVHDLQANSAPARRTVGSGLANTTLVWSPDSRYIFYGQSGTTYWISADSLSQPRKFLTGGYSATTFSLDGSRLYVAIGNSVTRGDAWVVPVTWSASGPQAGAVQPFLRGPSSETMSAESVDGRWAAYGSDETGISQVYVVPTAGGTGKWLISHSSGTSPIFAKGSAEVVFSTFFSPYRIMRALYTVQDGRFIPSPATLWSPAQVPGPTGSASSRISVAPDGKRAAVVMPAEQPLGNRVTFVLNFFDEVRRRVAGEK